MLRRPLVALVLLLCAAIPLRGQPAAAPVPPAPDSVRTAAHEAGRVAAGERGVAGYFAVSFVAGAPTSILLPLGALSGDATAFGLGSVGLGIIVATTAAADRGADELPEEVASGLAHRSPEYQRDFREAYARQLTHRRKRASLWGGAAGVGTGLAVAAWVVSSLGDL